jgi:predicted 2-oxoglutarate/Fe(II)-dependent dioxygenase YbiX/peroxiredoxin
MAAYDTLFVGDLAPWFRQRCTRPGDARPSPYSFDMAAGRHVVLCFHGSAAAPEGMRALALMQAQRAVFEAAGAACFAVSLDAQDEVSGRAVAAAPSLRHIWDQDLSVSRAYGVAPKVGAEQLRPGWFVLDPRLRVIGTFPLTQEGADAVLRLVARLPEAAVLRNAAQVPVLMVPGVFEAEFCARLIALFDAHGGQSSGVFTQTAAGEGAAVADGLVKRRRDLKLSEPAVVAQVQTRIFRRVVPEIRHAFQFHATRLERLILACYDVEDGGHFAPHRDNTVAATAHRRFAVSINLNGDFDGGGVSFPEYSPREFKPQAGGALVFSCAMMHAVSPMRRGRRMACLPFVYDDAAAALRGAAGGRKEAVLF